MSRKKSEKNQNKILVLKICSKICTLKNFRNFVKFFEKSTKTIKLQNSIISEKIVPMHMYENHMPPKNIMISPFDW